MEPASASFLFRLRPVTIVGANIKRKTWLLNTTVTTVTIVTIVTICSGHAATGVPSFDSVKNHWTSTEGALLDRHGELIHELRVSEQGRRLAWTSLDDISPAALV